MNLSAIHKRILRACLRGRVVCDIGGYEFVSYSQEPNASGAVRNGCL